MSAATIEDVGVCEASVSKMHLFIRTGTDGLYACCWCEEVGYPAREGEA